MPTPTPPDFKLGVIAPEDAVAALVRRQLIEVTFSWQDLWNEEHTRAFTVSRLTEERLLEVYRVITTPDTDTGVLFETYFRYDDVRDVGRDLWRQFAPIAVGALLILALVQISRGSANMGIDYAGIQC